MSFVDRGFIAGCVSSQKGRQVCFITALDSMNLPMLTPRFCKGLATYDSHTKKCSAAPNAVYRFDLKLFSSEVLFFFTQYSTWSAGRLVKVVTRNRKLLSRRNLVSKEGSGSVGRVSSSLAWKNRVQHNRLWLTIRDARGPY